MHDWDLAVSYFREDAALGAGLVKALHDRGVVVWVSEDTIPTAEEARAEFVDPSRAVLALLVSERTSQTIVFNDASSN